MKPIENANLTKNWNNYIIAIGLGGSYKASCARLCRQLKCDSSGAARKKVAEMVHGGKLQQDEAMTYLDAISEIESMYAKGEQTHRINTSDATWVSLGGGAHVRREFKA